MFRWIGPWINYMIHMYDLEKCQLVRSFLGNQRFVTHIKYNEIGNIVFSAGADQTITMWDVGNDTGWQWQVLRWHDDVPGVVTNNLWPRPQHLNYAPQRQECPMLARAADTECSEHSGHLNWNYSNNHRNKMYDGVNPGHFSPGKSWDSLLEPFEHFLMGENPSKWRYPIFFSCAANSI